MSRFYDPLADDPSEESLSESADGQTENPSAPRAMIEFLSPSQLQEYVVPEGSVLVGHNHIKRGDSFVIGGAPGVGKSRAAVALAVAGATGNDWFGLKLHRRFKTMILQSENGRVRLKDEFSNLDCKVLDNWVFVSPPPHGGFEFEDREFRRQLRENILKIKPDVFIVDTWSDCVADSMEKDYKEGLARIRSCLPQGDDCPALGFVAHTRKPRLGEKASGRALLNLLSGSQVIGRTPRAAFIIQPASEDTEDRKIVWTCCKNNDGPHGAPSAWELRDGSFAPVENFDWTAFNEGGGKSVRKGVTEAHLDTLFESGGCCMKLKAAAEKLQEIAGVGRTLAYEALKVEGGEFSRLLHKREDGTIGLLKYGSRAVCAASGEADE